MKKYLRLLVSVGIWQLSALSSASTVTPNVVDNDILRFSTQLNDVENQSANKCDYHQINCIKSTLTYMVKKDQLAREFWSHPSKIQYTNNQIDYFNKKFLPILQKIDHENINKLKSMLKLYHWINISTFGEKADDDAWLIVQHADQAPKFQGMVLKRLAKLYPIKETNPKSYAYLFDRVKTNNNQPQLYGTQIYCARDNTGKLTIKPFPIANRANIDQRRKEVGMDIISFDSYFAKVKTLCSKQFN